MSRATDSTRRGGPPSRWQRLTAAAGRLRRRLLPTPRREVTVRSWTALALFTLLYCGAIAWLTLTDRVLFARPEFFALLALAPWLAWLAIAGHGALAPGRAQTSLFVRLTLLGLLAAGLAEPLSVRTSDGLSVVYTLDTSDSIGEDSVNAGLEFFARTVREAPAGDRVALVAFGRNAAVELPPRESPSFEMLNAEVYGDATNIEEALQLAATLVDDEERGRIVLISDGTSTSGRVGAALDELAARGIAVDVLPLEYEYQREAWVERLELPQFVKLGEAYNATVLVSSRQAETGTLKLVENGQVIGELPVELAAGKNRFELPLSLRQAGFYEYEAVLEVDTPEGEADHDSIDENNTAMGSIFVRGQGRVMLVIDPLDTEQTWEPLKEAMDGGERIVELVESYDVPRDPLALAPYDCIVLANVARDLLDTGQVEAIRRAVFDQGIGFLMVGGENSFGAGGWRRSPIEEVLPVSLDVSEKKVLPKGALAIVLHTCEFPAGNVWAKKITREAIRVLSDRDEVGVIAFTFAGDEWIVDMAPASEYESMVPKINAASIGDMPAFEPAMKLGLVALKRSTASTRHMIIISDGDPQPPSPATVRGFIDEKVSVSMVAINPHQDGDVATMRVIAGDTGGNFYFPSNPNQLPAIFIKEAKTLRRNLIQKRTLVPDVTFPSPVLTGIDSLPPIEGYVLTSAKPRAELVLSTQPAATDAAAAGGETDPVLSIGRYGLGSTAAYTSDLAAAWNPQWIAWPNYQRFVNQLITRISRTNDEQFLRLYTHVEGGEAILTVEDFHPDEMFLDVEAKVAGPRGETVQTTLRQTGPRRYQASVPLWGKGRYLATLVGAGGGSGQSDAGGDERVERAVGGWIMPYSPEYLRFESDPIAIKTIRESTGGKALAVNSEPSELFDRREPKQSTRPVFDWLLAAIAVLLPLDVALRRVQLDWSGVKAWFRSQVTDDAATGTTATLLARATESRESNGVDGSPGGGSDAPDPPTTRQSTGSANAAAARELAAARAKKTAEESAKKSASATKPGAEPSTGSTAGKLLDLKRKRETD